LNRWQNRFIKYFRFIGFIKTNRYWQSVTFDDDVQLAAAQADPVGFVADLPDKTILDEIQRVPALFLALKSSVDRDCSPGRFILTGSANVLLVPKLADSLAGRGCTRCLKMNSLARNHVFWIRCLRLGFETAALSVWGVG
jgi:hypothetical protein